jgi:hypothetical protein
VQVLQHSSKIDRLVHAAIEKELLKFPMFATPSFARITERAFNEALSAFESFNRR